ncbi:RICIN domain-containing protein [Plantactinospora mayteni]|nr:RICIN domain-containing protein [Plantactinospora mayteni]
MTFWAGTTGWSMTLVAALVIGSAAPPGRLSGPAAHTGGPAPLSAVPAAGATPAGGAGGATEAARAANTARLTGVPVEIVGERTETSRVFANPSGTRSLEQYVLPVRARRDGQWVAIDTQLVRDADGRVAPAATPIGLRLSGGGSGPLVTAERDGAELALFWPEALPAPVLAGDVATYPEVLPGVDLRVRVNPLGFSQVLIVKNAEAARNPALRRIRFGTQTRGLTLRAGADGSSAAVDSTGRPVFTSAPPLMWDSTPAPAAESATRASGAEPATRASGAEPGGAVGPEPSTAGRKRVMDLEVNPGELVVVPDRELLTGADTQYPVYLDPAYSAAQYRWTMVNADAGGTAYWVDDHYREDMRVGAVYGLAASENGPWRTFFQMRVARLPGATVSRAWVSISMTHSASCSDTSVELWQTKSIDPAVALTWSNSGNHWLGGKALYTKAGKANKSACGQPPMLMEFGLDPDTITPVVQQAVRGPNGPQEAVTFGLRIPGASEGSGTYWKRFDPSTARLNMEYDTPPEKPTGVSTVPPTRCGTAAAPTVLNTATPSLSGVGYDRDGDNLTNELEILSGETVLTTVSASGTPGTVVRWSPVPAGTLPTDSPGTVFSYRVRSSSAGLAGEYGDRCYFTVDTARPAPPTVSSTDYPGPTPVVAVGEAGTVTFGPGRAETDVSGYRYGFSPDITTMWVAAGADGRASVPITLWPSGPGETGDIRRTLYARAIDRAGNSSPLSPAYELVARARTVSDPPVRGDVNGDRLADVTTLVDHGYGRTAVWNLLAAPDGFHPGYYIGWDTDTSGGFPADLVRSAAGDFDGDGRTDLAIFREDADEMVRLFLLRSDGNRFSAASEPVWTGGGFRLSHLKVVAGDFDGDGDDDLAAYQGLAGNQVKLWTFRSDRVGFAAPVVHWDSGAGGPGLAGANLVAGDFDGDGVTDIADVHDSGGDRARLMVHASAAGAFGAPVQRWDSGAGALDAGRARFVAANVDGDAAGLAEVVALVDDGAATARLVTIANQAGTWTAATWWSSGAGGFDATRGTLAAGDFDGDGRADIASLYDIGGGTRRLVTFPSTGTGFAEARTNWEGYVSDATPTLHLDLGRKYRIYPVHSGKCLEVPGGSTANNVVIDQRDCVGTAAWEQFSFEQAGASPYFHIRTAAVKCVDLKDWSLLDNTPVLQYDCPAPGVTKPNQQFQPELVSGGGYAPVVQLRVLHSDKCLRVSGGSLANGAQIVQAPCAATPPPEAQFTLQVEP